MPGPSIVSDRVGKSVDTPPGRAAIAELARLRGTAERSASVHKEISWATRKDYEIHVGITLEIAGPVGEASHEIRYWEFTTFLPPISSANDLDDWLAQQLLLRNQEHTLPIGMLPTGGGT
jgi:hypothetical protein